VPDAVNGTEKTHKDNGDIYITETTSPTLVKLFQQQFQSDFSLFLKLRYEELLFGGHIYYSNIYWEEARLQCLDYVVLSLIISAELLSL
jgi:hypothetical protein